MNNTIIVVPSKYSDVFAPCLASLETYAPNTGKVIVEDAEAETAKGWSKISDYVFGRDGLSILPSQRTPFCFAHNVNLGIKFAPKDAHIMICNDDVRFTHQETIEALEYSLKKRPDIGIVSPRIEGVVGNPLQRFVEPRSITYSEMRLAFVCVLVRREVIDDIGLLDERFGNGDYGWMTLIIVSAPRMQAGSWP